MNLSDLNRDNVMLLGLKLNYDEINNFCQISKKFKTLICDNNIFWMNKLNKDYPQTIGKFSMNTNFKKIYLSLHLKKRSKFEAYIDEYTVPPKIYSYISKSITDEDYELAEKIYPDFNADMFSFFIEGIFPKGTEMYLAYYRDDNIYIYQAFLTKEEAVNEIITTIENLFEYDYENDENSEKNYGGKMEDVIKSYGNFLSENDYLAVPQPYSHTSPRYAIIKQLVLVDYHKILDELKKTHPLWKKMPRDVLNYILKFLEN